MTRMESKMFVKTVWDFYHTSGRHSLPWRKTKNPYRILVSELMLQQTQVDRVIPKYRDFLKQFPEVGMLAEAPLGEVLRAWQGLGYNRRAKFLHLAAREVVSKHKGVMPKTLPSLLTLPGVGEYTAGAVLVFAYNIPIPILETNIRTVYLHHFFKHKNDVTDDEIKSQIRETIDTKKPREWFYALMDYGTHIKKTYGNPNSRSKSYARQSVFKGSNREIRGAILRVLKESDRSRLKLHSTLTFAVDRIDAQLYALLHEGMVEQRGQIFRLPR